MLIRNGNPYVSVRKERAQLLKKGWKKPMPVLVRVNGLPKEAWRINMMPVGNGDFYLYLHGYVRKASNTNVGDRVTVEVTFDDTYRNGPQHPMPIWFEEALANNAKAKLTWEGLIPSRKKEILRYFSWLKSDEAKKRNLKRAIEVLSGKGGRFMARDW
jgi:hypothetical protein